MRTRTRKITITIEEPLLSVLENIEKRISQDNPNTNLAAYIKASLEAMYENEESGYPESVNLTELSDIIKLEASTLIRDAKVELSKGSTSVGRAKFLRAASMECEALSYEDNISDKDTIASLLIILNSLKSALGFRKLPEV